MNIPKSPSLQLLRRLHHQPLGFNDISISSENDWESESTIIHRHSVSGSSRTSRCSSVLSCALDWEEGDKAEISLPTFIDYKTNEKPTWDFTDEMQRFTNKSPSVGGEEDGREEDDEEQQDETIMSEGNVDLELPKEDVDTNDLEDEEPQEENLTPLNRYQRELAKRIFVQNFSESTTRLDLHQFFSQYGIVKQSFVVKKHAKRQSPRKAFVQFATISEASSVLSLDPSCLKISGRQIVVMPAKGRRRRHGKQNKPPKEVPNENIIPEEVEDQLPTSEELNINHLSTELLEHIFSFLSIKERIKIERVCRRWRHIGLHCPWKLSNLKFEFIFSFNNVMTDSVLRSILKRCGNSVKKLDMTSCIGKLTYKALRIIGDYCPNLETVILAGLPTKNCDIRHFSIKCTKLKIAVLDHTLDSDFGEKGLWSLLKNNRNLEVLNVTDNSRIKGLCFHLIGINIRQLILNNCSKLVPKALMKLEHCKFIETLELNGCESVDTSALDFIFKHSCKTLKHLSLQGYYPLVNFQELPFEVLTHLEYLSLEETIYVDDEVFSKIIHHCPNIHTLNISDTSITNYELQSWFNFPKLKSLNLSHLHSVNGDVLNALSSLELLEELKLQGNEYLLDGDFAVLATNCINLREVDISSCISLTDETVDNFRKALKLRNSDEQKQTLSIKAGGTMITRFFSEDGLEVIQVNLCPLHKRPINDDITSYCDYDSDDEDHYDSDFLYDGDVLYDIDDFIDGWDEDPYDIIG